MHLVVSARGIVEPPRSRRWRHAHSAPGTTSCACVAATCAGVRVISRHTRPVCGHPAKSSLTRHAVPNRFHSTQDRSSGNGRDCPGHHISPASGLSVHCGMPPGSTSPAEGGRPPSAHNSANAPGCTLLFFFLPAFAALASSFTSPTANSASASNSRAPL